MSKRRNAAAVGLIVLAIGFLLIKGLGSASLYFREADEAVKSMKSIGSKRFRIEGVVVEGSVHQSNGQVAFVIEQNAQRVSVMHRGDPPELFQPNIPVVLEGRFAPGATARQPRFDSDRIMVKHTEQYKEKNPGRVKDYGDAPADTNPQSTKPKRGLGLDTAVSTA